MMWQIMKGGGGGGKVKHEVEERGVRALESTHMAMRE